LNSCNKALIEKVGATINEMELLGKPMFVIEGYRTQSRQQVLYASHRTLPGPWKTDCDGVKKKSNHQLGLAADCGFRNGDPYLGDWVTFGKVAKSHGLVWGGDWEKYDACHVELP
jgi:peptidoglycan L-alanyl-D-glutamate endopeptidase CwlK